ncbi:MAG: 50S ribosomal protein L10 [Candidatus Daviesbacteria bacterium]|nr:50S ribosomal protein L10 [Candidatus Daviesbacteria bacterium]
MKTRAQKEESVKNLTEKFKAAKTVVFTDYRGMTMNQLSDLRNKLAESDAELEITKNTLVHIALDEAGLTGETDNIAQGPTATLFGFGDEILPIKTLTKAIKDNQVGVIKGGFLNGGFMEATNITRLSNLPSKLELQAKIVGSLSSPLYGMVNVLQGNLRNLVYALDQIRISKGGEL